MPDINYRGRGHELFKILPIQGIKISTNKNEPSIYVIESPNFIVAICVIESISIERVEEWQKPQMMLMWVWYVLFVWSNSSTQENFLIVVIAFVKLVLLPI